MGHVFEVDALNDLGVYKQFERGGSEASLFQSNARFAQDYFVYCLSSADASRVDRLNGQPVCTVLITINSFRHYFELERSSTEQ